MENNSFEEKMKKLNEIVEKLSDESVSLNDSLNLYVEGKELIKELFKYINEAKEKVQEICNLIPAMDKEIDYRPGQTRFSKDQTTIVFKNGSYFDNIAARETSRGKRRHGGVIEECVGVDGDILSQVIIPTMNISRMCMDGTT